MRPTYSRHLEQIEASAAAGKHVLVEKRRCLKIIPNAFGEKAVLKLMFAAMTRAAERWRAVKVTDFERRQMMALREELDSEYEAQSYYLKLLARTDPKGRVASRLVKYLLNNRKHATYWNSTRDTAIAIEAMAEYLKASGEDKPDLTEEIWMDGRRRKQVKITSKNLFQFDNKFVLIGDALESGPHRVELRKEGKGPILYRAAREEHRVMPTLIRRFVDRVLGGSSEPLVAYLAESEELSAQDIKVLRAIARKVGKSE